MDPLEISEPFSDLFRIDGHELGVPRDTRAQQVSAPTSVTNRTSVPHDSTGSIALDHREGSFDDGDTSDEPLRRANGRKGKGATANETTVRLCGHCQQVKKPPRGKKLAWRNETGRWMYVHQDAPDSDDADQEVDMNGDEHMPPNDERSEATQYANLAKLR